MVSFPERIPQAFEQWQVSYDDIDGQQVEVVRGANPGQTPVDLHFDESGLLVRLTRWTDTGPVPFRCGLTTVTTARLPVSRWRFTGS